MFRHFLNPPNWFTSASLFCGLYAIILATGVQGHPMFYRAALMILFAAVFDMLDGRVARMTRTSSEFGVQLDSLADMVSFGIAPAVLLYAWGIHSLGTLGLVGAFAFAVCGAFRLARFNMSADLKAHAQSEGLTITMAGATVAAAVMAHAAIGRTNVEHPLTVWLLALVLAFLMVTRVPYRTFKTMRLSRSTIAGLALTLGVIMVVSLRFDFSIAFLGALGLYVASGPLEAILRIGRHQSELDLDDDLTDLFEVPDELPFQEVAPIDPGELDADR